MSSSLEGHPTRGLLDRLVWSFEQKEEKEETLLLYKNSPYRIVARAPAQPALRLPGLVRLEQVIVPEEKEDKEDSQKETTTTTTTMDDETQVPPTFTLTRTTQIWVSDEVQAHRAGLFEATPVPLSLPSEVQFCQLKVEERIQEKLHFYLQQQVLPRLLVVALLEDGLHRLLQEGLQNQQQQQQQTQSSRTSATRGGGGGRTRPSSTRPPLYYKLPPTQYLSAPVLESNSSTNESLVTPETPTQAAGTSLSTVLSRLRAAGKLLHDYCAQERLVDQYHQAASSSLQRRSTRHPPPPPPQLPPVTHRGGRICLYILKELQQELDAVTQSEEQEEPTHEKDINKDEPPSPRSEGTAHHPKKEDSFLPADTRRPRLAADSKFGADTVVLEDSSKSENEEEEEAFTPPPEAEDEDEEEEESLPAVDPREVQALDPGEEMAEPPEEDSDDESSSNSSLDLSQTDLIYENPHLQPTPAEYTEAIGKHCRTAWTLGDLQEALVQLLKERDSFPVTHRLDRLVVAQQEQEAQEPPTDTTTTVKEEPTHIQCECTSHSRKELSRLVDASDLGKAKVSLVTLQQAASKDDAPQEETKAARKRRLLEEYQAAEQVYKTKKAWASWRFKSMQQGCTAWPSWEGAYRSRVKQTTEIEEAAIPPVTEAATVAPLGEPASVENHSDLALAEALAEESSSGRRRTRRAAGGANEATPFYGMQTSMTQKQLMDAIVRICSNPQAFQTLMKLQMLIAEESSNPLHRIRIAVGRLVYKRNQLTRCPVNVSWSDAAVWQLLAKKPLWAPFQEPLFEPPVEGSIDPGEASLNGQGNGANDEEKKAESERRDRQLEVLTRYLREMHRTELQLRSMVMKQLTLMPISTVAGAADERAGSMEALDAADFESESSLLEWSTTGHVLLGKVIYRPPPGSVGRDCKWYRIQDFVPSVELDADEAGLDQSGRATSGKEPLVVERRMRFRAFPFSRGDILEEYTSNEPMILTEAQVHAGLAAANMYDKESTPVSTNEHPFAGATNQNISLEPMDKSNSSLPNLSCKVVGHDTVTGDNSSTEDTLDHRILILPDAMDGSESPAAFWASVSSSKDGAMTCRRLDTGESYSIGQADFLPSSLAFQSCRTMVEILRRQPNSQVFMEPVDPVALNIPSYFSIVKHPMDISTLSTNLESGMYSQVPPSQNIGRSPIARMLNGPFRTDMVKIFDNALLFNPPDDWIYQLAASMKKHVLKKLDQMSTEADQGLIGTHYLRPVKKKRSIYVDYDSDVDMYDYDNDRDDPDFDAGRSSKRKRSETTRSKEEASARAIEAPIRLQYALSEAHGLRGPFADLSVSFNAAEFSMTSEWGCRHKAPVMEAEVESAEERRRREELEELVALHHQAEEMERAGLRRSSRSHAIEQAEDYTDAPPEAAENVEYFIADDALPPLDESTTEPLIALSRTEVETRRETLHEEYYAKLYQKLHKSLVESDDDMAYGGFENAFFPPFLGRVLPSVETWEIQQPYLLPAMRWVLRGLVKSGHLSEVADGVLLINSVYNVDEKQQPFDELDVAVVQRRRRVNAEADESSEEEVELSEYEQLRAQRVARNAERLKALGLA